MTDRDARLAALQARLAVRLTEDHTALAGLAASGDPAAARAEAIVVVHKLVGLAGPLGRRDVSDAARALEVRLLLEDDAPLAALAEYAALMTLIAS